MRSSVAKLILILAAAVLGASGSYSQTAADNTPMGRPGSEKESYPHSIRDSLEKMRIEREKKEFDKMIERGQQVTRIAAELEAALLHNGYLTEKEKAKLASVEKLAKQIRSDLGGGDDEEEESEKGSGGSALNISEAVRTLKASTEDLFRELKKTSRFTISAAAIYSSNAVLRLARFMRFAQ
jgi:hypothetical protein